MNVVDEIRVELDQRSYPIRIGPGLLESVGACCAERGLHGRCLVVADAHTAPLYGERVCRSLEIAGFESVLETLPAGEETKCTAHLLALYDAMLAHGMDRKSFVVALGGGVIGDLAGYAAASFLRGIPFVQLPTSLLAMVDSSVGGKTGINLPQGKNLVGAFHQPRAVLMDLSVLATLPEREYRSGLAEVIKYGLIYDAAFFDWLEARVDRLAAAPVELGWKETGPAALELLAATTARCCAIKAEVVAQDEREGGLRAILNFGHTVGHGIENSTGYGTLLHGEAVAVGMVFAARASVQMNGLPERDAQRLERMLHRLQLPIVVPGCAWAGVRHAMTADKKSERGLPKFVLVGPLGTARTGCGLEESLLEELWDGLGQ